MAAGERHRALVGLGSNLSGPLGNPADYVQAALERIEADEGIEVLRRSRLYRSAPWGNTEQDDFINAVIEVATSLQPGELLRWLLGIETELGRRRGEKWGPRLIDLDLLSFDDREIDTDRLVLPHPQMHQRAFVLVPLLDIVPDFRIPGRGRADHFLAAIGQDQQVIPL